MNNYELLNFKNLEHKKSFHEYEKEFEIITKKDINESAYYFSLVYLLSLLNKNLTNYITKAGFNGNQLLKDIKNFSTSEKIIINLALHLFNDYYYNLNYSLPFIFNVLDNGNKKAIIKLLKLRFDF